MSQCGDSLFWARSDGSAAGGITATCLSLTMPSNVQNYQLIVSVVLIMLSVLPLH